MTKSFTLFLNTANPKNYRQINSTAIVEFYIDWNSFLPQEYTKFDVTTSLKSQASTATYGAVCRLSANFSGNSYDQTGTQNSFFLTLTPKSYYTSAIATKNYFESTPTEFGHCTINRPTNNYLVITINAFGGLAAGFPGYILFMKFTPIID